MKSAFGGLFKVSYDKKKYNIACNGQVQINQ